MSTGGDVQAIGKHCELEYCRRLDFLPSHCRSCDKHYCTEHTSKIAHKCTEDKEKTQQAQEHSEARSKNSSPTSTPWQGIPNTLIQKKQCSKPTCKTQIETARVQGNLCSRCNRKYCLSHRHEEQHDCSTLEPIGARPSTIQPRVAQSALTKISIWAKKKVEDDAKRRAGRSGLFGLGKSTSSAAVAAQTELNALKRVAKGDAKIPPEKRIYLIVEASSDTTRAKYPTGKFFYSKDMSVGRVLDMAAKALMVENINNRSEREEDKLRVFFVQGGRLLKYSEKIGDATQNGNMIVLLRGVGDGEANLIDL